MIGAGMRRLAAQDPQTDKTGSHRNGEDHGRYKDRQRIQNDTPFVPI